MINFKEANKIFKKATVFDWLCLHRVFAVWLTSKYLESTYFHVDFIVVHHLQLRSIFEEYTPL